MEVVRERGGHDRVMARQTRQQLRRDGGRQQEKKRNRVRNDIPWSNMPLLRAVGLAERERTVPEPSGVRLRWQYKAFVSRPVSAEMVDESCAPMIGD